MFIDTETGALMASDPTPRRYTKRNVVKNTRLGVAIVKGEDEDGEPMLHFNLMGTEFRNLNEADAAKMASWLENDAIPFLRNFVRTCGQ